MEKGQEILEEEREFDKEHERKKYNRKKDIEIISQTLAIILINILVLIASKNIFDGGMLSEIIRFEKINSEVWDIPILRYMTADFFLISFVLAINAISLGIGSLNVLLGLLLNSIFCIFYGSFVFDILEKNELTFDLVTNKRLILLFIVITSCFLIISKLMKFLFKIIVSVVLKY